MDCLVTKLKGVVNDDSLNILGAYYLTKVSNGNSSTNYITELSATESGKCKLMVYNGTLTINTIDYTESGYTLPTEAFSSPINVKVQANAGKDAYLYVTNRHYLKKVNMNFTPCAKTNNIGDALNLLSFNGFAYNGEITPLNYSNLKNFMLYSDENEELGTITGTLNGSKCPKLKTLSLLSNKRYYSAQMTVDIDTLDLPLLETFSCTNMVLSGSIANLNSVNVKTITIRGIGNDNANNIEAFAKRQVAMGRTSGTCTITIEATKKIVTFTGSGDGYSITDNGVN